MSKVLVVYYSRSGNTKKMAELVAQGARDAGAAVDLKSVKEVGADDLLKYDGIVAGSPTYYGLMSCEMKEMFDKSVKHHGKLDGKVGGAFSSAANIGGGNETTILAILQAMLIHGMIVQGDPEGDHYGPVAIQAPDARAKANCIRFAKRLASLVKRTAAG